MTTVFDVLRLALVGGVWGVLGCVLGYVYLRHDRLSQTIEWKQTATRRDKVKVYYLLAADRYDLKRDLWFVLQRGFLMGAAAVALLTIFAVGLVEVVT